MIWLLFIPGLLTAYLLGHIRACLQFSYGPIQAMLDNMRAHLDDGSFAIRDEMFGIMWTQYRQLKHPWSTMERNAPNYHLEVELQRINRALEGATPVQRVQLLAAQAALQWALEPNGFATPSDDILA